MVKLTAFKLHYSRNDIAFIVGPGYQRLPTATNDMTGIWHENQWPVGCHWLPTNDRRNIISDNGSEPCVAFVS